LIWKKFTTSEGLRTDPNSSTDLLEAAVWNSR